LVACFNGVEEVVGSNPAAPTSDERNAAFRCAAFSVSWKRRGKRKVTKARATQIRTTLTIALLLIGVILSILSLAADFLGLDLTPGFGLVQMLQLLVGLTSLTTGAFLFVYSRRRRNAPRSLQADIGVRLAATGLVFAYVSGMSDVIGIGTHVTPNFERPFVGPLQLGGIALGIISILVGLFLYNTSRGTRESSSMEFLVNGNNHRPASPAAGDTN
jgi:hypothetical protein